MSSQYTVAETIAADNRFSILSDALRACGLDIVLSGKGPFTLCAPTDRAFHELDPEIFSALIADPQARMFRVLQYHILFGNLPSETIRKLNFPKTRLGITIEITENCGVVIFGGTPLIITDISCTNGVIHGIDQVVIPP